MAENGYTEREELSKWKTYRTGSRDGYNSVPRDARGYPIFVRASQLSKDWALFRDEDVIKVGKDSPSIFFDDTGNEQLKDIVSVSHGSQTLASESPSDEVTLPRIDDPSRGKAVASFYSSLPRMASTEMELPYISQSEKVLSRMTNRKSIPLKKSNNTEWFIRKASAKLQDEEFGEKEMKPTSAFLLEEGVTSVCSVCFASLSHSLTQSQWESHRSSIAHQLAADGPAKSNLSPPVSAKRKSGEGTNQDHEGKIILKSSNLGYVSLQRMGWRRGMGLGREEWEFGLRRRSFEAKYKRDNVIVISDSEDEADDRHLEIGSEQWLANIRRGQARLKASRPRESSKDEDESGDLNEQQEAKSTQERPLLEPISVQFRPDRRGIGKSLPLSSRIVDDNNGQQGKRPTRVEIRRLTKSQRRARERQEKEEWKQLRNSLN